MDRNLASLYVERNLGIVPLHQYPDLCPGLPLHSPDHAVLRKADAGDIAAVNLQDPVPRLETCLLGRASGYDLKHYGRVIGNIELNPDAVEVAGELGLRLLQLNRRKIDGMRVESSQGGLHCGIRHLLHIDLVHVILLNLLKDEVEFPPLGIIAVQS